MAGRKRCGVGWERGGERGGGGGMGKGGGKGGGWGGEDVGTMWRARMGLVGLEIHQEEKRLREIDFLVYTGGNIR